ncbi:hypothetical protein OUZ56_008644 [Daphnia magna]|uniref:Uncharacterized protein n=1 Tax=Daphnia magna TaxID=35525 RepID=A0ABR0ADL3_9CRUS|nr:hypothetical protein OUZ56_008644 [Daphnia magna]
MSSKKKSARTYRSGAAGKRDTASDVLWLIAATTMERMEQDLEECEEVLSITRPYVLPDCLGGLPGVSSH